MSKHQIDRFAPALYKKFENMYTSIVILLGDLVKKPLKGKRSVPLKLCTMLEFN